MEKNKKQYDKDIEYMKQMLDEIVDSNKAVDEKLDAILEEIDYINRNQFEEW